MPKPQNQPPMTYRFLGRTGLKISAVSLGGWLTYGGHVDEERTMACMKAAYDCGVNFFDCAEEYSKGESEVVMGKAIKHFGWKRNDLVISTKIYWGKAFGDNPVNNEGLSRKHVIEGLRASLKRLDLDYVDVVYAHRPDRQTPMEETVRAFNFLINQGLAFYWATSEWRAEEIALACAEADRLGLVRPVAEQPKYNMIDRTKVEQEFLLLYPNVGLGLTVFSPMKLGILSGKYANGLPENSRFANESVDFVKGYWKRVTKETWDAMIQQVNQLKPIADRLGVKMSQLALGWVLKNENVSSAIVGASSEEQVYENCAAVAIVDKITPEIMAEIDEVLNNKPPALIERYKP